ncbi:aegerolysin family protein [Haloimpatiens sp. FM7330]|uniref:aegerolysin family protein n=1 Tax=Haloimpatiens sp. FM7330 TaxID=3298610 RepID=UPI00362A1BB3
MSSRTIEITIQNDTGKILSMSSKKLQHGKWLKEPSKNIGEGQSCIIKAGNRDGALIGTTGNFSYSNENGKFELDFDKPFGSSKTVVNHNASGPYESRLENDNLQHHHSTCTINFYKV